MLMPLGQFVFELQSAPFEELRRQAGFRLPRQSRVGARPAVQFLGPGDDPVELSGVLMPEITGGPSNLDSLRAMAEEGSEWPLISGSGENLGNFAIEGIRQTSSRLLDDGTAQRIEFSIALRRVEDYQSSDSLFGGDGAGADSVPGSSADWGFKYRGASQVSEGSTSSDWGFNYKGASQVS
jgi:phage protein U